MDMHPAEQYVALGWHLVPIPSGQKGPTTLGWHRHENLVRTADRARTLQGNIGLAHVPSHTFALDVDDYTAARSWLSRGGVNLDALVSHPEAVRISSGREGRTKLLYARPEGWLPRTRRPTGSGLEFRCADKNGNSVQDVLPPSIHPDTGRAYAWDLGDLASLDALPLIPDGLRAMVDALNAAPEAPEPVKDPLGLSPTELAGHLARRDPDCGYDDWLAAGMALHHESRGAPWGLKLWNQWSAKGAKYQGWQDLETRWSGFRADESDPITARWLLGGDAATSVEFPDETKTATGEVKKLRFTFEHSATIPVVAPIDWLVRDVLPRAELGVLYGEPGSGKSFLALDLGLAIARGTPWRDKRTAQGTVAYICAEGAAGFRRRYAAYMRANDLDPASVPFWLLDGAPNLHGADHMEIRAALVAGAIKPALIVIDTLARTMGGADENSGEDMGAYIQHAGRLSELTGAMVLIVHHSGKDASRGARGHSSLRGAVDVELEVAHESDPWRVMTVTKQKDGEELPGLRFKLREVLLGMGEDGEEWGSCVVEHGAEVAAGEVGTRKAQPGDAVLAAVDECADMETGWAEQANVIVAGAVRFVHGGEGNDKRNALVVGALNRLVSSGRLVVQGTQVKRAGR